MCKQVVEFYEEAFSKMREASFQSHSGHWDMEGTGGKNCPECIRANKLRHEADALFDRARNLYKNITIHFT